MKFLGVSVVSEPPLTRSERWFFRLLIIGGWGIVLNVVLFVLNQSAQLIQSIKP